MERGWIKLHRELRDNPMWYKGSFDKGKAWVDLLFRANHTEKKVLIGNKFYIVKAGEFITSQKKLAQEWGWCRRTVSVYLTLLESEQQITHVTNNLFTKITITNWGKYQNNEQQSSIKTASKQHQSSTNKNDKECKEDIEHVSHAPESDKSPSHIPYEKVMERYNDIAGGYFGKCTVISEGRKKHIRPFYLKLEKAGITLDQYFRRAVASDFLRYGSASRPWHATFDWLINQNNAAKVMSGNYDNTATVKPAEPVRKILTRRDKDDKIRLYEGMISDGNRDGAERFRKACVADGYDPKLDKEA